MAYNIYVPTHEPLEKNDMFCDTKDSSSGHFKWVNAAAGGSR